LQNIFFTQSNSDYYFIRSCQF